MDIHELVDTRRYPLDRNHNTRYARALDQARLMLDRDGCAVLPGFVRPQAIPALISECDAAKPYGHYAYNRTNAYFTQDDPTLPPEHPKRRFFERTNAFIPADRFGHGSALRAIYDWSAFAPFIQTALREPHFYRYADPLADVIVNIADEGNGFPWHFDTNNYTVTLALQNAESGGDFQYAPNIRRDSENFDTVGEVLDGTSDTVCTMRLQPGDLQIFRGRYSLHRVTPLTGAKPRYVAIFSYAEHPDMVATPERCHQLYGKALPIHYQRAGQRSDRFLD